MQLEYLSQALDMAAIPGLRIVRHSGQYGNALLTRLPIVSVHRHDLSYCVVRAARRARRASSISAITACA